MDINGIGDEGAETIARALATNASLKKLSLHYNDIGEVGATALMAALVTNETLEALALGHLPMTEELCKVSDPSPRLSLASVARERSVTPPPFVY